MKAAKWTAMVAVAAVLACGPPKAGERCDSQGAKFAGVCASATAALECRNGLLTDLPCKGPGGCVADSTKFVCDVSGNIAGDGCSLPSEGAAQCNASNPKEALKCTNGRFVAQSCPTACSTSNGQVFCN